MWWMRCIHTHSIIRKNKSHLLSSLLNTHNSLSLTLHIRILTRAQQMLTMLSIIEHCFSILFLFASISDLCKMCFYVRITVFSAIFQLQTNKAKCLCIIKSTLGTNALSMALFLFSISLYLSKSISSFNLCCLCHFLPSRFHSIFPPLPLAFAQFLSFSPIHFGSFVDFLPFEMFLLLILELHMFDGIRFFECM